MRKMYERDWVRHVIFYRVTGLWWRGGTANPNGTYEKLKKETEVAGEPEGHQNTSITIQNIGSNVPVGRDRNRKWKVVSTWSQGGLRVGVLVIISVYELVPRVSFWLIHGNREWLAKKYPSSCTEGKWLYSWPTWPSPGSHHRFLSF